MGLLVGARFAVAGEDFRIVLLSVLLASNPAEVVIEWVDYWR